MVSFFGDRKLYNASTRSTLAEFSPPFAWKYCSHATVKPVAHAIFFSDNDMGRSRNNSTARSRNVLACIVGITRTILHCRRFSSQAEIFVDMADCRTVLWLSMNVKAILECLSHTHYPATDASLRELRTMQVAYRSQGVHTVVKTCDVCYNGFIITSRKVANL